MPRTTRMWVLIVLVLQPATAAPVFRCLDARGIPIYTDQVCPGRGEALDPAALQPNVYVAEPLPEFAVEEAPQSAEDEPRTGCDNADDLRHIDLMLKSLTTDKRQRRFLQVERRRVQACELARLPPAARRQRDAALTRTRSLLDRTRDMAEQEIEGLYRQHRPRRGSR
jgi:hypothetical protein